MRPVIGITADIRNEDFLVRRDYAVAVSRAGGCPVALVPPLPAGAERFAEGQSTEGIRAEDVAALAEMIDGLLIPGGGDIPPHYYGEETAVDESLLRPVSGEKIRFERMLIDAVIRDAKPLLAICYGMQLLNVALGGTLYQDVGVQRPDCSDHTGGEHAIECGAYLENLGGLPDCTVNTSHHQAIKSLGRGLDIITRADDGIIEGIRLAGHPFVVGVQWHPERAGDPLSLHIFAEFIRHAHVKAAERAAAA